ncbi:Glycosyltransferase, catalytic subunit of cellulose synthase and poly-beta-1,6-N-acetylglucosamine synthase [Lutibacter agarilyticus]|uniref:Glycosyltransferase, catalytic subunit of cellulose synthase and poly-beta-1,6-N-acetylglucosamine synthase n=1 Tax=Lutibacter agarilyticus TaxID=1109740 RepID=A0A238WNZ7_9FLAO|nr:glycosyltransferase [Lutibacter agarilyticus]SNR47409.1 Glycosyltransferase, catalytic subunit of cellulose synthase and poly-beta-1,6-N-acetylglucosamine synthase [Lutibacter agarilyticus]
MIVFTILIFIVYTLLVLSFMVGFDKIKLTTTTFEKPNNHFSIIIPFRNEAANLKALLQSILELNYPTQLFEILLVNDDSYDDSFAIIETFQHKNSQLHITLIQNNRKTGSPKKDAINTAIENAQFNWLITTDADCEVPKNWLNSFNTFIEEKQPVFISAPVKFQKEKSLLFHFQNLNFISLIGSTIGGFGIKKPFLCNGANLCYRKDIFKKINGFEGNNSIASGDDIFLLEKMFQNYPTKTLFLKSSEAVVSTKAENSWKLFFNQQIRWASKTNAYKNWFSKMVGLAVFTTNLAIVIVGVSLCFTPHNWMFFIAILVHKMFIDVLLIEKTTQFLNAKDSLLYYPLISIAYPLYIVFIASASLLKKYEWKGRIFKQ